MLTSSAQHQVFSKVTMIIALQLKTYHGDQHSSTLLTYIDKQLYATGKTRS